MSLLVINAGSSTLKFALFSDQADNRIASGMVDWRGTAENARFELIESGGSSESVEIQLAHDRGVLSFVVERLRQRLPQWMNDRPIVGVGHRVVHGGQEFVRGTRVDERVCTAIEKLAELAPLHNPPALAAIRDAQQYLPQASQVACFDTAYFAELPKAAVVLPVPFEWYRDWGVRRFGFHGISHKYCAGRAVELLSHATTDLKTVICHLGSGCSATAVKAGRPVATTMSFTPMDGLMMGTRAGSLDPGLLLHLQQQHGMSAAELETVLNKQSGLLGVSGVSSDYRQVEAAARDGHAQAQLALEMFTASVCGHIGDLASQMGGIDALVFTAGIGTNSPTLRNEVCRRLGFLGVELDPGKNEIAAADVDVATEASRVRILVLETKEEEMIARETLELVGED